MRMTKVFISNVSDILEKRGLDLAWLEERTGLSEVYLKTFEYIASSLSFRLVLTVALALGVSVDSLISEGAEEERVEYATASVNDLYAWFWRSVSVLMEYWGLSDYELADVTGKTVAGIDSCRLHGKVIDVQRAQSIALWFSCSIDDLVQWRPDPVLLCELDVRNSA